MEFLVTESLACLSTNFGPFIGVNNIVATEMANNSWELVLVLDKYDANNCMADDGPPSKFEFFPFPKIPFVSLQLNVKNMWKRQRVWWEM